VHAAPSGLASQPAARPGTPARLAYLYQEHVVKEGREPRLLITLSFFAMFLLVRFITHSIRDRRFTWLFHNVGGSGGTHIHHLVFGIFGLLIAGYIAIGFHPQRRLALKLLAVLFGVCAALTIDEFALWLTLQDVYWAKQGRDSVDAAISLGAAVTILTAGRGVITAMARDCKAMWRDARKAV